MELGIGVLELRRGGEVVRQVVPVQPGVWAFVAKSVLKYWDKYRDKPLEEFAMAVTPILVVYSSPDVHEPTGVRILLDSRWSILEGLKELEEHYKPVDVSGLDWREWCTIDLDSNTITLRRRTGSGEAVIYSGSIDGFLTQEGDVV